MNTLSITNMQTNNTKNYGTTNQAETSTPPMNVPNYATNKKGERLGQTEIMTDHNRNKVSNSNNTNLSAKVNAKSGTEAEQTDR